MRFSQKVPPVEENAGWKQRRNCWLEAILLTWFLDYYAENFTVSSKQTGSASALMPRYDDWYEIIFSTIGLLLPWVIVLTGEDFELAFWASVSRLISRWNAFTTGCQVTFSAIRKALKQLIDTSRNINLKEFTEPADSLFGQKLFDRRDQWTRWFGRSWVFPQCRILCRHL